MSLARTGGYTAAATVARLIVAFVVAKLVASFAGPAGMGRLGQFLSLMSVLAVLAGGGIGAGIVKYVAEYRDDPARLARLLATALGYVACASILVGVLGLAFSRPLAGWLLGDPAYASLVCVLALAQLGIALVNYVLAVVNGFMDVRRLALIQVTGSTISVVAAVGLAQWLHLYGVLLALVLGQLLWLAVAWPAFRRSPYFRQALPRMRFDREMTGRLASFSLMTITSALAAPLVNILVRQHLVERFGWTGAGYWQAVSRVSDAYLLFLTAAINVYYLPKLAATHGRAAILRELRIGYRLLIPAVALLAVAIYLLRDEITRILFSADFVHAGALYAPQLLGDVLKIASFVLSYLMLAKAMTRLFVVSECVFALLYLLLVYLGTAYFGLVGAMYAFALNYAIYLVFNLMVARRYLGAA
jgi:polysaccharide transporter, PST family